MNVSKTPSLWRKADNDKHEAILRPLSKKIDYYIILPAVSPEGDEGYWESHHVLDESFPSINKAKQHLKDAGYLIRTHWY